MNIEDIEAERKEEHEREDIETGYDIWKGEHIDSLREDFCEENEEEFLKFCDKEYEEFK